MLAHTHDELSWLRWQWLSMNLPGKRGKGEKPQPGSPKAEHDATTPVLLLPQSGADGEPDEAPVAGLDALTNFMS